MDFQKYDLYYVNEDYAQIGIKRWNMRLELLNYQFRDQACYANRLNLIPLRHPVMVIPCGGIALIEGSILHKSSSGSIMNWSLICFVRKFKFRFLYKQRFFCTYFFINNNFLYVFLYKQRIFGTYFFINSEFSALISL